MKKVILFLMILITFSYGQFMYPEIKSVVSDTTTVLRLLIPDSLVDLVGTNWRVFYVNGSGVITELSLGASGTVLKSNGASSAPTWQTDATGAGGSAYADSVAHDGRNVIGDSLITDYEGDARFAAYSTLLLDLSDGTISQNFVNTTYPWDDNEVVDNLTASNYLLLTAVDDSLANYLTDANIPNNITVSNYLPLTTFDDSVANYLTDAHIPNDITAAYYLPLSMFDDSLAVGSRVQAYDADLADLADGSLTASKVAGVADADYGDVTVSSGVWSVEDNSHLHTTYLLLTDADDSSDARITYALTQAKTITGNWINTTNPWADNEVADNITASSYLLLTAFDDSVKTIGLDSVYAKTDTIRFFSPIRLETGSGIYGIQTVQSDSGIFDVLSLTNKDYGDITWNGTTVSLDSNAINFSRLAGSVTDAQVPDNLTASNYLLLTAADDSIAALVNRAAATDIDTTNLSANWNTWVTNHENNASYLLLSAVDDSIAALVNRAAATDVDTTNLSTANWAAYVMNKVNLTTSADIDTLNAASAKWTTFIDNHLEATLADIKDGTIAENLVNTANPWDVNEGGSGAATFTANGALYGNTTSAFQVTAAHTTNGSLLIGDGSGVPTVGTITGGSSVTVTNGAGTITLTAPDTLTQSWFVKDTVVVGELPGWKAPYAITIIGVSAYTDTLTTTFNLEERAAATPNTAGTDVFAVDMVAVATALDSTSFTNSGIVKGAWIVPTISATGDNPTFSIIVAYKKN